MRQPTRQFILLAIGCLALALAGSGAGPARAQAEFACFQHPLHVEFHRPIWVISDRFCLLRAIALPPGEDESFAFTALASGDDGALYAAAPLRGEIWRFQDEDGDELPDLSSARVILRGLRRPAALAWRGGALYIVAGRQFLRWRAGELETLIDDLPAGGGFWNGGLAFDEAGNAYIGIGAPCAPCPAAAQIPPARASIVFVPAGQASEWQPYAGGLRQPAGLAWFDGSLWATDTTASELPDELNRIQPGGDYGWPACEAATGAACGETQPPALALPAGSVPLALTPYAGAAFPELQGRLLIALAGDPLATNLSHGFSLVAATLNGDEGAAPAEMALESIAPSHGHYPKERIALQGLGFWPQQILGLTVDGRGWLYFTLSGGQILALRPT